MATNRSADTAQKPVRVHSVQRMKREEIKVCEVKHLEDSADLLRTTLEIRLNSHLTAMTFNRLYGLGALGHQINHCRLFKVNEIKKRQH